MSKRCVLFGHKLLELLTIEAGDGLTYKYYECAHCPDVFMETSVMLTDEAKAAGHALLSQLTGEMEQRVI